MDDPLCAVVCINVSIAALIINAVGRNKHCVLRGIRGNGQLHTGARSHHLIVCHGGFYLEQAYICLCHIADFCHSALILGTFLCHSDPIARGQIILNALCDIEGYVIARIPCDHSQLGGLSHRVMKLHIALLHTAAYG